MEKRRRIEPAATNDCVERRATFAAKGVSKRQLQAVLNAQGQQCSAYKMFHAVQREAAPLFIKVSLSTEGGGSKEWDIFDPTLLVQHVLEQCPALAAIYAQKLQEHPCSPQRPWRMLTGFDEHTPGDKLKVHNLRKSMVLAINFLELGPEVLLRDCTWFIPVVLRSSKMEDINAGWSQALRVYLRRLLLGPSSPRTAGIPFTHGGVTYTIFATLSDLISDGVGHMEALQWKGAKGLKPCIVHSNVWSKGSGMADEEEVDITCHDCDRFVLNTHRAICHNTHVVLAARARYHAGRITKAKSEDVLMVLGTSVTEHGLFADTELPGVIDIVAAVVFDWMHTLFQDGAMSIEMFEMTSALERIGYPRQGIEAFLKTWSFPSAHRSKGGQLHRIFDDYRVEKTQKKRALVGGASEQYALYPLLRFLVDIEIPHDDRLASNIASFRAGCKVVDLIKLVKTGQLATESAVPRLLPAAREFLEKHKAAYGVRRITPKFHWMFDCIITAFRRGMSVDMFILERLHLRVRPEAELVRNTSDYERSALALVLCTQLHDLQNGFLGPGLRGRVVPFPGVPGAVCADEVDAGGVRIHVDDIVFRGASAGCVLCCFEAGGCLWLLVEEMYHVERVITI